MISAIQSIPTFSEVKTSDAELTSNAPVSSPNLGILLRIDLICAMNACILAYSRETDTAASGPTNVFASSYSCFAPLSAIVAAASPAFAAFNAIFNAFLAISAETCGFLKSTPNKRCLFWPSNICSVYASWFSSDIMVCCSSIIALSAACVSFAVTSAFTASDTWPDIEVMDSTDCFANCSDKRALLSSVAISRFCNTSSAAAAAAATTEFTELANDSAADLSFSDDFNIITAAAAAAAIGGHWTCVLS